jgi:hypothetical protein
MSSGKGPLHRRAARTSVRDALLRGRPPGLAAPAHIVPYGTVLSGDASQALRAWLRSDCPSGTKYILRTEALIKLAAGDPPPDRKQAESLFYIGLRRVERYSRIGLGRSKNTSTSQFFESRFPHDAELFAGELGENNASQKLRTFRLTVEKKKR